SIEPVSKSMPTSSPDVHLSRSDRGSQPFSQLADIVAQPRRKVHSSTIGTTSRDHLVLLRLARGVLDRRIIRWARRHTSRAGASRHRDQAGSSSAHGVQPLDPFRPEFEGRGVGQALDAINRKFATTAVGVGLGGMKAPPDWEMKRELLSRRCLTNWDELLVAAA